LDPTLRDNAGTNTRESSHLPPTIQRGGEIRLLHQYPLIYMPISRLRRATDEELEGLGRYQCEPLARKLERAHPEISARLYRALCIRIVEAGKSKSYGAALSYIKEAKKCYAQAGLHADWQAVVGEIREKHFRKKGFMVGFERIVSGTPSYDEPSFLDRAKERWAKKS
jgi:hypothetical protein